MSARTNQPVGVTSMSPRRVLFENSQNEELKEELERVKAERDFYHSKLMRVKEKLSDGRLTTPTNARR